MESSSQLGEALGLQTNFQTSYSGAPIQRAVQMGIQNQMKQDVMAAKQAAQEEKLKKEIEKGIVIKTPKMRKPYLDEFNKVYTEFIAKAKSDPTNARFVLKEAEDFGNYLKQKSDYDDKVVASAFNTGTLVDKDIIAAVNSDDATKRKGVRTELGDVYVPTDENDPVPSFTVTAIPKVDLSKAYQQDINDALKAKGWDEAGGFNEQYYKAIKSLTNEEKDLLAERRALDPTSRNNRIYQDKAEAYAIYDALPADIKANRELANLSVAKELFKKDYAKEVASRESLLKKYQPKDVNIKGGGTYKYGENIFTAGEVEGKEKLDLYVKEGVITEAQKEQYENIVETNPELASEYLNNLPKVITISTPNKGAYKMVENGKAVNIDNTTFDYIQNPTTKKGKWYVTGTKKIGGFDKKISIPINESTYGQVISSYKMGKQDLVSLLNDRLKEAGITNDKFVLNVNTQKNVAPKAVVGNNAPKKELTWAEKQALKKK